MNIQTKESSSTSLNISQLFRLWMAVVLGILAWVGPLSLDMYLPALPSLAKSLNTSTMLSQLSITACIMGLSLGQLFAGLQSDVRGRRVPLLVGLVIFIVSSILCAMTTSIWVFILLRFIQGLSGAVGMVISRAIVRDLYSGKELTKFLTNLSIINGAGPILAPIAGGLLLQITTWRGVFVTLSIVGLFMLTAVFFGIPETLPVERRSKAGFLNSVTTFGVILRDRGFMAYALPIGFVIAAMFAYISASPFVIQNIYGASPQLFSIIFAINGLGIIIGGQITGRLAKRISEAKIFVGGLCLALFGGVSLLLMILIKAELLVILPFIFIIVTSVGILGVAGGSLAMERYGDSAGSASALLGLFMFIFAAIAAPLVGIGGGNTALPMGIIIVVANVSAILSYFILKRRLPISGSV